MDTFDDSVRAALTSLAALEPLTEQAVVLPRSGDGMLLTRPVSIDQLLDRAEADPEQHLPYWANIWPSGLALADAIACAPDLIRGRRVLELGCGLGSTAVAALRAGGPSADLLVSDYAEEALALCRRNTQQNVGREPVMIQLNWRKPTDAFRELARDGYDVVLAADVLYEQRDIEPLLAFIESVVAPDGLLWLAEPDRLPARLFLELATIGGWTDTVTEHSGPWPDPSDRGVTVRLHQLRRSRDR